MKTKKYLLYSLYGIVIIGIVLVIYFLKGVFFVEKEATFNNKPPVITPEEKLPPMPRGKPAPNFSLKTLDGKIIRLSTLKGKVIIIDFWATWCPPCREEIPHFINLYEKYKDEGFQMLGVFLDDNINSVREFAKNYNINYPLLIPDEKILKDYGPIIYIPTTFIISKEGYIYKKYVGYKGESIFEDNIKTLLRRD
ncbi:TlpA family protein disulfide reductase [Candidatus Aerophobetes bacterium]|nr:TlpA family protein disulfide reductase [Candidatus Aerophobetes bacterium]